MSRTRRSDALKLLGVLAVLQGAVVLPSALAALPPKSFPAQIEALARYDPQSTCSPSAKAGTLALRSLVTAAYAGTGDLGIVRGCDTGGVSEHKEGRAWDWKVNAFNAGQDAMAKDFLATLLATDVHGNEYAVARRLGVMYMIYNKRIWSAYNPGAGWRPYTGANPHSDHVHISLSRAGGDRSTSYWVAAPPVAHDPTSAPVLAKWQALGAAGGELGAAVRGEYAVPGGRAQDYRNGRIYWSTGTGAVAVLGAVLGRYDALGGPGGALGLPVADEAAVTGVPAARFSRFRNGSVYWSPSTGVGSVRGAILNRYLEAGGPAGPLGLPRDDEAAAGAGRRSTFQGGRVVWSLDTGAHVVAGAIGVGWDRAGGATGRLGLPTSSEVAAPRGARAVTFQNGVVLWSPATGVAAVQGAIFQRYQALGGPGGSLGLPLADEVAAGKGRVSRFSGGRLVWGQASGAHLVAGAIGVGWDRLGGAAGPLGLPTTSEQPVAGAPGARTNAFQGGGVYWSPGTGVTGVYGDIARRYEQLGGAAALGLPVADEVAVTGGRMSAFQRGRIFYGAATGAHPVVGAVAVGYDRAGGPGGLLGLPTSGEVVAGRDGRASSFQRGQVIWSPATGPVTVTGSALAHLDAQGGVGGFLGFPVGASTQISPGVSWQLFQGGRVYVAGSRATSVRGAILTTYLQLGGSRGQLGLPVSDEYVVPEGRRSDFERGALVWDARTGAVTRR